MKKKNYIRVKTGTENTVTLKEPYHKMNDFFESNNIMFQIDDVDSFVYIMNRIGFTQNYIMEKYRLDWNYKKIDFFIDELPFGIYLEIKGKKEDINKIIKLLKLDENELIKETYWEIFKRKNINNKENINIIFYKKHIFKIAMI